MVYKFNENQNSRPNLLWQKVRLLSIKNEKVQLKPILFANSDSWKSSKCLYEMALKNLAITPWAKQFIQNRKCMIKHPQNRKNHDGRLPGLPMASDAAIIGEESFKQPVAKWFTNRSWPQCRRSGEHRYHGKTRFHCHDQLPRRPHGIFRAIRSICWKRKAGHIKNFWGGGVILPEEIRELMDYGIANLFAWWWARWVYRNDQWFGGTKRLSHRWNVDGQWSMVNGQLTTDNHVLVAQLISLPRIITISTKEIFTSINAKGSCYKTPVLGITGTVALVNHLWWMKSSAGFDGL